ncbi:unnamed protein product [Hapterophycus canaliculatus]
MVGSTPVIKVALIGRNSRCKALFLKAASSSEQPLPATTVETESRWTCEWAPRERDLAQAPEHGFSPTGERFLSAQLSLASATDVVREEGDRKSDAVLLVVSAEIVFHLGQPRPTRGGVNPVKAAVIRTRERLGGGQIPFAVAVSVDVQEDHGPSSAVKAFLISMKNEMAEEGIPVVAVSPQTELWLREQESEGGRVSYRRGDSHFRIHPSFEQLMDKRDIARARAAFDLCGGTGIVAAVSAAIRLDTPTLVFPVGDFLTLQSSGWCGDGAPAAPLRTCRLLKSNSSARDLFDIEKKAGVVDGELVSAEVAVAPASSAARAEPLPLELDAPIGKGTWLVRLIGSRKTIPVWKKGTMSTLGGKGGKPLASVQFGDLRSKDRRRGRS